MPKFAVGETVDKDQDECGVVVGIFTTAEGHPRYAVEKDGSLQFVLETRLAPHQRER
jgi:hypothetical protein